MPDRPALGDADEGQERFLLVTEHVQGDARGRVHLRNDPGGVGEPSERLGADKCDSRGPSLAGLQGIYRERVRELRPPGAAQEAGSLDGGAEPEKDRFVDERLDPMVNDPGNQEVNGGRTQVDGRPDLLSGCLPRHRSAVGVRPWARSARSRRTQWPTSRWRVAACASSWLRASSRRASSFGRSLLVAWMRL